MNLAHLLSLPGQGSHQFFKNIDATYIPGFVSLAETVVIHQECSDTKVAQHNYKIQFLFNTVNACGCLWDLVLFAVALKGRAAPSLSSRLTGPAMVTAAVVSLAFIFKQNSSPSSRDLLSHPQIEDSNKNDPSIAVGLKRPFIQKLAQYLYAARITANIGSLLLMPSPLFLCTAFGAAYNLVKLSKVKWLKLEQTVPYETNLISQVKYSYFTMLLPSQITLGAKERESRCQVCLREEGEVQENDPPTYDKKLYHFCATHLLDIPCLINRIIGTLTTNGIVGNRTDTNNNGIVTSSYPFTIDEVDLPKCDNCSDRPPQALLEVYITDKTKGVIEANVLINNQKERPSWMTVPVFKRIGIVYSSFQAVLAYTQQAHFELFTQTKLMQRVLYVLDAALLIRDLCVLADDMQSYYKQKAKAVIPRAEENPPSPPSHSLKIAGVCAAILLTTGVVAWLGLNRLRTPVANPQNLLINLLHLPPSTSANLQVAWNSHWYDKIGLWVQLARFAANVGSFGFKRDKAVLLNNLLQAFTLYKTSQSQWLKIDYKQTHGLPMGISNLSSTFYFVLPPHAQQSSSSACQTPLQHVSSSFESVYKTVTSYFNHSNAWSSWWNVTTTNGVETGRKLKFGVTVKPPIATPCGCAQTPLLDSVGGSAFSAQHRVWGEVSVTN